MTKIENIGQYNWTVARVEQLLPLVTDETPIDSPESIELELLSNLVADYSETHFSVGAQFDRCAQTEDVQNGLNPDQLAKMIGVSASRISEYLSGKSEPTLKIGRTISRELNIDANIVLGV